MRTDVREFHFLGGNEDSVRLQPQISSISSVNYAPRCDSWICVGDSTNKGESMHFPEEETKRGWEEEESVRERGREKTERWRWQRDTGSVTVSCRLVSSFLPGAPGRSLAHNMESINPHRIPLSPPDTCPVCLPLSLSICLFVCIFLPQMYIQDRETVVSEKCVI